MSQYTEYLNKQIVTNDACLFGHMLLVAAFTLYFASCWPMAIWLLFQSFGSLVMLPLLYISKNAKPVG